MSLYQSQFYGFFVLLILLTYIDNVFNQYFNWKYCKIQGAYNIF